METYGGNNTTDGVSGVAKLVDARGFILDSDRCWDPLFDLNVYMFVFKELIF